MVAFQGGAAQAAIDVPAKAVWSLTDIDSLQFCHKCNPDDVLPATRTENYRRTIIDTVAMGARQILVHVRSGPGRAVRVGEFAAALATYNATASAADRACMAIMYADYGATHTDAEITALFSTAWDTTGANYCAVSGRPVVATLDDRPDQTCAPAKITNIINRIRTLPSGVAPAAVHWVAGFGERSEYTAWDADCRGKISGPGIPIAYSYLEMANDDPQFAADAATRRDAVKATGGRYILGLPSASAQNCGDFCGTDADSDGYRHTDFGGFARLLGAWRAGADNVAYTFGPGGPYGKDQFASSAIRCGANDLATSAADCAAIAMEDEPLIPGVPGDGQTIIDDRPTGPQCTNISPPPPAAAIGATHLAFCDDFSKDSVARGATAAERNIAGDKKWTTEHAIFYSSFVQPAGDFRHDAAAGTMRIAPSVNKAQSAMQSVGVRNSQVTGFYIGPWAKYYVEMRYKMESQNGGQPAFWHMDMCHWLSRPYPCSEQSSKNQYLEMDLSEYNNAKVTLHLWTEANAGAIGVATPNVGTRVMCQAGPAMGNTVGVFATYGWSAANNVASFFKNDTKVGASLSAANCPSHPMDLLHKGRQPILIGGKPGDVIVMDFVRVWKAP